MILSGAERRCLITEDHLDGGSISSGDPVLPRVTNSSILAQAVVFSFEVARGALESVPAIIAMGAQESVASESGEYWRSVVRDDAARSIDHFVGERHCPVPSRGMAVRASPSAACNSSFSILAPPWRARRSACSDLKRGCRPWCARAAIFGLMGAVVSMMARHRTRLKCGDKRIGWVVLSGPAWTVLLGS